jgi:hypothetical protein
MTTRLTLAALLGAALLTGPARADSNSSLQRGTVELKSAGALAFGPENILFVGDSAAGMIYAIGTGDTETGDRKAALSIPGIDGKIAELFGATAKDISVTDMKVNPMTGNVFLAVTRGKGPSAGVAILRADRSGKMTELSLKDVPFAKVELLNLPKNEKQRTQSITSMAFIKDRLFVAGLSNEEFASTLRAIPFPFKETDKGTGIEIFHGNHGRLETNAPIRTFTPFEINGQANLLASYTCTPLVRIPVEELKAGAKVRGTTIAELGNMNVPLDMIVYQKDGKTFILMSNTARGVMKITTDGIDKVQPITARVGGKAGLTYDTIESLKGVVQMDKLNDNMALVLVKNGEAFNLSSVELP